MGWPEWPPLWYDRVRKIIDCADSRSWYITLCACGYSIRGFVVLFHEQAPRLRRDVSHPGGNTVSTGTVLRLDHVSLSSLSEGYTATYSSDSPRGPAATQAVPIPLRRQRHLCQRQERENEGSENARLRRHRLGNRRGDPSVPRMHPVTCCMS